MKKIITVLLMLNLLMLLLSACADEQMEFNPHQIDEVLKELAQEEEPEHFTEIETAPTPEPLTEPVQVVGVTEIQETTDNPQDTIISTPTETLAPAPKTTHSQTPVTTPNPTQSNETTQSPNQTATPTPQPTPEPVQQSIQTPQATPEPVPEPIPEPISQPTPPPVIIITPPPSRTICNTCGADITSNLVEHGTAHLINDENFSYRNE